MIGICRQVIIRFCICKIVLSVCPCRNNNTRLALDLHRFFASKPDREFDRRVFILASLEYCISKSVDTVIFHAVESRDLYTVDLV